MSYPLNYQQQYMPAMVPTASCGAVSINIMNPTVGYTNPMGHQQYYGGVYQYPQASYYSQQPMQIPYPMNYNNNINNNSLNALSDDNNAAPTPPAPSVATEPNNTQQSEKQEEVREKIPLTDDYIKSLENYLNSQDPKIRLMAAKDVLERFKEDPSRQNDVALTALLNKILQDPNSAVRFLGLASLDAGYAKGDQLTINILNSIKNNTQSEHGEDSRLASQILLRLSAGDKVKFTPKDSQAEQTNQSDVKEAA